MFVGQWPPLPPEIGGNVCCRAGFEGVQVGFTAEDAKGREGKVGRVSVWLTAEVVMWGGKSSVLSSRWRC